MITFKDIKNNAIINEYIRSADEYLSQLGYTEHAFNHVLRCVGVVKYILTELGYDDHTIELAMIATYMHDIGNVVNRDDHAKSGALMAFKLLSDIGMDPKDISLIVTAIGNHDESSSYPVNVISSALILADKTDVRRSRVRKGAKEDIHTRVNYAAKTSNVEVDKENKNIILNLQIDTKICSIMDYFEIFLSRMLLCKKASEFFSYSFKLIINGHSIL